MPDHRPTQDTRQTIIDSGRRIMSHKGFASVGLNEILAHAGVPKGSFYHWFPSKEAFGQQMIDSYFTSYLAAMDLIIERVDLAAGDRLGRYFSSWREAQLADDPLDHCLITKLGSEVAETHPGLRAALDRGSGEIIDRLEHLIEAGVHDGSVRWSSAPRTAAEIIFDVWIGAGVRAKLHDDSQSFDNAMTATVELLRLGRPEDG